MQNRAEAETLAVQEDVAKDLESWMSVSSSPNALGGHLYDNLLEEMRQAHASSVRASVSVKGQLRVEPRLSGLLGEGACDRPALAGPAWPDLRLGLLPDDPHR
jgi:hypothetical protein